MAFDGTVHQADQVLLGNVQFAEVEKVAYLSDDVRSKVWLIIFMPLDGPGALSPRLTTKNFQN